jgi:2-(1,2-epoxy-1,2-dihydrophenyl)acetyl-CoA isomerase
MRRFMTTSQLLHTMPKVTIAAVNGPCAGAGMAWACACDLRIAGTSAVFKTAFLSAGLSGDFGGTWTF